MVLMTEIFPYHLRATACSLGLFVNRLVSGVVASSFLSISEALTPHGAFVCFGIISTLSFVFVLKLVPETRGKSLEEMEAFFRSIVEGTAAVELDDFEDATDNSPQAPNFDKLSTDEHRDEDDLIESNPSGKSVMM